MPQGYREPRDVHVVCYFEDMGPEQGPTEVIPGSHRDRELSPYRGEAPRAQFLPRKQDVVLWDQRVWHRGTPRTAGGYRIAAISGFFGVPSYGGNPRVMPEGQRAALARAADPGEEILFGGYYGRSGGAPEADPSASA